MVGGGGGGGEKFVGHCHSIMHEVAAHMLTNTIYKFSSFLGERGIEAGGEFQVSPLCMKPCQRPCTTCHCVCPPPGNWYEANRDISPWDTRRV